MFTPKGEVKSLPAGATPLDFAYAVHTDVGHRCVGAKVNGRIVPLHYMLQSGEFVEVLTSKQERGPSRDWMKLVKTSRARNKIRQWFTQQAREDLEQKGRESLQHALKTNGLPHQKVSASPLLAGIIREMGFKKADDFYVAIGGGKIQVSQVVTKLIGRLKTAEVISPEQRAHAQPAPAEAAGGVLEFGIVVDGDVRPGRARPHGQVLHARPGRRDLRLHLAGARHHDPPRRLPQRARAASARPSGSREVRWDDSDTATSSFRVTIALQSWDRPRLLEDVARTFAEHGANIVEYGGHVADQMARNWYTAEVGDVKELRAAPAALRNIDSVFDAYRVTPGGIDSRLVSYEGEITVWQGNPSWKAMLLFYVKWTLLSLIPVAVWVVLECRPAWTSPRPGSRSRRRRGSSSPTSSGGSCAGRRGISSPTAASTSAPASCRGTSGRPTSTASRTST